MKEIWEKLPRRRYRFFLADLISDLRFKNVHKMFAGYIFSAWKTTRITTTFTGGATRKEIYDKEGLELLCLRIDNVESRPCEIL